MVIDGINITDVETITDCIHGAVVIPVERVVTVYCFLGIKISSTLNWLELYRYYYSLIYFCCNLLRRCSSA